MWALCTDLFDDIWASWWRRWSWWSAQRWKKMIPTSQFQRRRPKKKSSELNSVCGDIIFRWVFVSSSIFCNTCAVRTTHWVRARHTKFYKYYILMLLRQAWGSSIEYRHSFLLLSECYLHYSAMNFSNYWAEAHRPQLKCYIVSFYGEWKACTFKWSSIFRTRFPLCIPYDVVVCGVYEDVNGAINSNEMCSQLDTKCV